MACLRAAAAVVLLRSLAPARADDELLITLPEGRVQGVSQQGFRVFRGIPYAAPPVGDRRWRPPAEHPGWNGVLDASDFGPSCVSPQCWETENLTRRSEDCLTVNVIAPAGRRQYPVMVYIHAGEFHCGTSNDAESNWPNFAEDVVLVTLNYRIGAFGFLGADELRARDPRNGTGNYGLLDQHSALQWVRRNIRLFRGDPERITLWGESSGATSVAYHLTASGPMCGDLFQRAILQSPGLTQVKSLADAEENHEWLLAMLTARQSPGCPGGGGYLAFQAVRLLSINPRAELAVRENETVSSAQAWCDGDARCMGFWRAGNRTTFMSGSGDPFAFDLESNPAGKDSATFLKSGPREVQQRQTCLLSADAKLLDSLTETMPRDDTFQTDAWAPVVDGIYLTETIVGAIAQGKVCSGVDVLIGTNLDEGTEFMSLTPPLRCDANASALQAWARAFYGAEVSNEVTTLYKESSLERPLPACGQGGAPADLPGEEAVLYNAAMRSAGDAAVRCPAELLALRVRGRAYVYRFSLTPAFSENFGNTTVMGAFHGAEVPFVFNDTVELSGPHERRIADAMGCYWRSFAWHGDPGAGAEACGPRWPEFRVIGKPVMNFGEGISAQFESLTARLRCRAFLRGAYEAAEEEQATVVV